MPRELRIAVEGGAVSGLLQLPDRAGLLLVFGHGAGAGMRHPFMAGIADRLAGHGVATLRYQFPYVERGSRRPDPQPLLLAAVRAAAATAAREASGLPRFIGGKSMGGRMSSLALAEAEMPGVRGVVFFGFPLHRPGTRDASRAAHLARVAVPLLFLQGTRDRLADLELLRPLATGPARTLHVIPEADHGFHVPRRSGRDDGEVLDELARVAADWMSRHAAPDALNHSS